MDPAPGRAARTAAAARHRRARLAAAVATPVAVLGLATALVLSPVATPEVKASTPASAEVFHRLHFRVSQSSSFRAEAARVAMRQRGKPYRWGGTGPGSFDCSGLTSFAYQHAGRDIPRTSSAQRRATAAVHINHVQPGDLLFYGGHVAMYVGRMDGRRWMVEAPNSGNNVRVVALRTNDLRKIGRVRA